MSALTALHYLYLSMAECDFANMVQLLFWSLGRSSCLFLLHCVCCLSLIVSLSASFWYHWNFTTCTYISNRISRISVQRTHGKQMCVNSCCGAHRILTHRHDIEIITSFNCNQLHVCLYVCQCQSVLFFVRFVFVKGSACGSATVAHICMLQGHVIWWCCWECLSA